MNTDKSIPQTLLNAVRHFSDLAVCTQFVADLRWSDGVVCPHCGGKEHWFFTPAKTERPVWKCKTKACRKQFSVKTGTIFEDSPLGLDKWLVGVWVIVNAKNGISSHEVGRALGVTQKTAWFMLHRIRLAMKEGTFEKLTGQVEIDETYIGGKNENKHKHKRLPGRGGANKAIVMGFLARHSQVRAKVISDTTQQTFELEVLSHVEAGSEVFTDAHSGYAHLSDNYVHEVINHLEAYVCDQVHTNGIENFWSLLKRCIRGTYIAIDAYHLGRYLDEEVFRYNNRKLKDAGRFVQAISAIKGRRLTYQELTKGGLYEGA